MYEREFLCGCRLNCAYGKAEHPSIQRAPVRVQGICPIATDECVTNIQIRDAIRIHGVSTGPSVHKTKPYTREYENAFVRESREEARRHFQNVT